MPIAFPAVRGKICIASENYDDDSSSEEEEEEECNVWAPCPTTSTCECTWYRGTYYCFGANTTDPTSSFHPSSTYYPVHLGLEWAAKYIVANTDDDDFTLVAPNKAHAFATTTGDDDAWLLWDPAGCDDYVLYMADVFGDGWNGAEFSITERNGGLAQIFDFNAGEGEIDDDSGYMTKTQTIFLCPNRVYDITITDGIFPSEIFFEMEDPSGVSIFSGSNPPFSCTLFGEDDDDDDTCSVRRRLLPQQKKKRTRRRHLTACANPSWTGDGWCDAGTNTADCSWDGGDCCEASCVDGAYVCGSNGYNCLEPNPTASPTTLAPTTSMPPSSEPTISSAPTPMPSAVPSVSPSMGYTFNLFNMPAAALLPCTDVDPDGSRGVKCSSLQYDFPAQSCSPQFAGDATCHEVNNHIGCGFDLGDCCPSDCEDTELLDCNDQFDSDWDQCFAPGYLPNGDSSGWPYFIELSDESKFTTVPYTFAASILDVVEAQQTYAWNTTSLKPDVITSSPERPGPEYIPSMACGDCAAYSGSPFMSIPFHVTTTEKNEYEMFAKLQNGTARVRYFAEPNIVIGGGPLLTQLRLENRKCRKPPFNDDGISLDDICLADPDSRSVFVRKRAYTLTDKFGVDATWSASSELYRETNKDLLETLYPDSNDLRGSGLPYGFFADAGSDAWDEIVKEGCEKLYGMNEFYGINPFVEGMQCNRFPVLFDTNWNTTRVKQVLTLLRDGGYFDGNTALASLQLVTFNVETRLFYYIQVYAQKLSTGEYSYGYSIRDINAEPYAEIGDYIRLGFEIAFIFAVLMLITVELGEMKNAIKETGSVISYFLDLSNVVDIANYCLIIVLLVFAIRYNVGCAVVLDKARFRFDHVYRDFYAVGRILQMNGDQGVKLTRFFRSLNALAEIRSTYNNCIAVFLILVCLQLVKNLSFHPMLGMISHTLYFAANDLAFFVVLLAVVNTVYAFLGTLLFGSYVDNFSTFSLALSASLNILSGNYMPLDDTGRDAMQQIYYWSHMLINFFLLLNFMLAIIVDSYQKAKVEVDANPFYDFRRDPIRHLIRDAIGKPVCKAHHIPDDDLLCLLLEATRRLKDQGAVDGLYTPPMGRLGRIRGRMMRDIEDRALKRVQDGFYTDFLTRSTKLTNIDLADSLNFFVFSPSRDRKKVALSQTLIGSALGIALADLPKDISKVICFNLLERWGVNPDQNRDGIVDDDELRALRELYDVESTATNAAKAKDGELLVRAFVGRSRAIQSARGGQPSARGGSLGY